jgi:hypothetical protein
MPRRPYIMKNTQREEAQQLFFQSNLTKTDIASRLNVSRRTITLWSHQGNWDTLRRSARSMPAMVAEKCYHLLNQYTTGLLGDNYTAASINIKHAQTIHLLASSIRKIKNRSTVNESMEMFNFFLDGLTRRNPALAAQVAPELEEYIGARAATSTNDHLTDEFASDASVPFPADELKEQLADEKDEAAINEEFEEFLRQREEAAMSAAPPPTGDDPMAVEPESDDNPPVNTDTDQQLSPIEQDPTLGADPFSIDLHHDSDDEEEEPTPAYTKEQVNDILRFCDDVMEKTSKRIEEEDPDFFARRRLRPWVRITPPIVNQEQNESNPQPTNT